jgi:hypothetical protein
MTGYTPIFTYPTTALFIEKTAQFLILKGDHRDGYKDLETLDQHLDYFYSNVDQAHDNSEHGQLFSIIKDEKGEMIGAEMVAGGY